MIIKTLANISVKNIQRVLPSYIKDEKLNISLYFLKFCGFSEYGRTLSVFGIRQMRSPSLSWIFIDFEDRFDDIYQTYV